MVVDMLKRKQTEHRDIKVSHCLPFTPIGNLLYQFREQGLAKLGLPNIGGRSKWSRI